MSKTFGLKFQSRVLCPFPSKENSAWLVATHSLREENEIRVVEFDEKSDLLTSPSVFIHSNEIWDLAVSPNSPEIFLTLHNDGKQFGTTLWKSEENNAPLSRICDMDSKGKQPVRVQWQEPKTCLILFESRIETWDISGIPKVNICLPTRINMDGKEISCGLGQDLDQFSNMHISNTNSQILYVTNGQGYQIWDLRDMKRQQSVEFCHDMPLKEIDTAQHFIATCGDDWCVRIWDDRNPEKVWMEMNGHTHWVWDCKFNQKHPSLLLSSSSDATVVLWEMDLARSNPDGKDSPKSVTSELESAVKASTFQDHDESVYRVRWSLSDDWIFASLSYDGRLAVNRVPSDVKYKILI